MIITDIIDCVHTFKQAFLSVCPLAQAYSDRFKHFVSIHKILCRNDPTYITYNYVLFAFYSIDSCLRCMKCVYILIIKMFCRYNASCVSRAHVFSWSHRSMRCSGHESCVLNVHCRCKLNIYDFYKCSLQSIIK